MLLEEHKTGRLLLRKVTPEILEHIYGSFSEEEQMAYLGFDTKEELKKEKLKFKEGLSTHNRKFLYFKLFDPVLQNIWGWCGYHTWYTDHDRAEIGYGLFSNDLKRQGLMTEAMRFTLDYGFNNMNLHRVEAFIGSNNEASLKLAAKFGFQNEGVLREHYFYEGRHEDSEAFGLLKSEYKAI